MFAKKQNEIKKFIARKGQVSEIDLDHEFDFLNNSDKSYSAFRALQDKGIIKAGGWKPYGYHPEYSSGGSYFYSLNKKMKK